jgi:hypothetical protein
LEKYPRDLENRMTGGGTGNEFVEKVTGQVLAKSRGKYTPQVARIVAVRKLQKSGLIDMRENLTAKGMRRAKLSSAQRAFQRARLSAEDGGIYDPVENKVVRFG